MRQTVVQIDRKPASKPRTKRVKGNQKAIDALPLNSGQWRVTGVPGLYVRCRAETRSYVLQRRVNGELVKKVLGAVPLKEARDEALREWGLLKPEPAEGRKTFARGFEEFLEDGGKHGQLADKTRALYRYNLDHYLSLWKDRTLEDIGKDRAGVRDLFRHLARKHGKALGSQVIRMFAAVYRHARKADLDLPESPTVAVSLPPTKARDWAMSPEELQAWWRSVKTDKEGKETIRGVSTLGAIKRMWWLAALLTGARRGSIEALKWSDVDTEKKTIRFRVTKGDRPYMVPVSDKLTELLTKYRDSGDVPPSMWVFPSSARPDHHIVNVRDDKRGVSSAHHLRHTFRTVLAELGASPDHARLLMGHSMSGDVSRDYITSALVMESLRPVTNTASERLLSMLGAEI